MVKLTGKYEAMVDLKFKPTRREITDGHTAARAANAQKVVGRLALKINIVCIESADHSLYKRTGLTSLLIKFVVFLNPVLLVCKR
jgi:hypothetical protein